MTLAYLQSRLTADDKLTVHYLGVCKKFVASLSHHGQRISAAAADDLEEAVAMTLAKSIKPSNETRREET